MPIDMFESKFRNKIKQHPRFSVPNTPNAIVQKAPFPAWRYLFESAVSHGQSTGYRVPNFEQFYQYLEKSWLESHPDNEKYRPYFQPPLRDGMRHRAAIWYQSGMVETQVYLALAQALEDQSPKPGMVMYDVRVDCKLKVDMTVICNGLVFFLNVYWNKKSHREAIEKRRDEIEKLRKKNTSDSSHWHNNQITLVSRIDICFEESGDFEDVNGLPMYSYKAINRTLEEIYRQSGVYQGFLYGVTQKAEAH